MSTGNYRKFGSSRKSCIYNNLRALFWSGSDNFRCSFGGHPCDTLLGPFFWISQHQPPATSLFQRNRGPRVIVHLADVVPIIELA